MKSRTWTENLRWSRKKKKTKKKQNRENQNQNQNEVIKRKQYYPQTSRSREQRGRGRGRLCEGKKEKKKTQNTASDIERNDEKGKKKKNSEVRSWEWGIFNITERVSLSEAESCVAVTSESWYEVDQSDTFFFYTRNLYDTVLRGSRFNFSVLVGRKFQLWSITSTYLFLCFLFYAIILFLYYNPSSPFL